MLVCPSQHGFNYTKAKELKYNYRLNFILGKVTNDPDAFVWNGNGTFTWSEIHEFLFDKKEVVEGVFYFDYEKNKIPEIFRKIWPYYKCVEYSNYSTSFYVGLEEDIDIYLIDPNRFITHRVIKNAMKKDAIYQTANKEQNFDSYYKVQISAENLRPEKGTCTVYSHHEGFNICVQVLKLFLFNYKFKHNLYLIKNLIGKYEEKIYGSFGLHTPIYTSY